LQLAPGEAIYLFTDGITEAANQRDELFGEERLEAILREMAGRGPHDLIGAVTDAVQAYTDGAPQSDDITAMAIRRVETIST
jgi:sigma-B regulation protein RsbU (phosphoserine phosphatase)